MFKNFLKKPVKPLVGMKLEDKVWGKEYTVIEITRVSKDSKNVLYKYIIVQGTEVNFTDDYESSWNSLLKHHNIIED